MRQDYTKNLSRSEDRIGAMQDETWEFMEDVDHAAWELHDRVRDLRVSIGRLFANQSDFGRIL